MHEEELNEHGEEAIWLRRQPGPVSSFTKLGGLPELPSSLEWPRQSRSGTPLHFLAQIDLSILPPTPLVLNGPKLPASGFLFFFADMVEEMLWRDNGGPSATTRVIFSDQAGAERSPPDDIPDILHTFGQRQGGYNTGIAVYPAVSLLPYVFRTFNHVSPYPAALDTYSMAANTAMAASIEKALGAPIPSFDGPDSWQIIHDRSPSEYRQDGRLCFNRHQMLGIGKDIQGTAEGAREDGDILLLQIDSDTAVHRRFMFCDMGVAQFWIKPDDLASKRFHNAWATTEG